MEITCSTIIMKSKQVLSIEQMQHLQELGLNLKPSLVHYYKVVSEDNGKWYLSVTIGDILDGSPRYRFIPAYTLQDVLDALPIEIKYKDKRCWLCIELADEMIGYYYEDYHLEHKWVYHEVVMIDESLIDAVYKLLCWAIEQGYVETNKNE